MMDFTKPLPSTTSKMTEDDIRALRDFVFEKTLSDESWNHVSHRWLVPIEREWLLQTARAMQTTRIRKT